jgi:hypothetical protein
MSKRKRGGHKNGRIIPSAEALEALKGDDYPAQVKLQLRLSQRGGRQRPRQCLACGKAAAHIELYVKYTTMTVGGNPSGKACKLYWTCEHCHAQGLTESLEHKLIEACR